jgi:hypothetical protein
MNFNTYLGHQMAEDRRAFVVHFPARSGKTQYAQRISQLRRDIYYLDLQAYFLEHHELPPIVDCDVEVLKKLLLGLKVSQSVILVDNPDFLFNTWDKGEKNEFLRWVNRALRSPTHTQKTFVFFFQDDPDFLSLSFDANTHREPRLLPLNSFDAL